MWHTFVHKISYSNNQHSAGVWREHILWTVNKPRVMFDIQISENYDSSVIHEQADKINGNTKILGDLQFLLCLMRFWLSRNGLRWIWHIALQTSWRNWLYSFNVWITVVLYICSKTSAIQAKWKVGEYHLFPQTLFTFSIAILSFGAAFETHLR